MIELYYKIKNKLFLYLGLRYWYDVDFKYKSKNGKVIYDFNIPIGVLIQSDILNSRLIKQSIHYKKWYNQIKKYVDNGTLIIDQISYLGCFKKKQ